MTISATTLDGAIHELASRGELSHLSLVPSQEGKMWRASFTMCSRYGVSLAEDADPVKAIMLACSSAKMRPAPKTTKPTSFDLAAESSVTKDPAPAEDDLADIM